MQKEPSPKICPKCGLSNVELVGSWTTERFKPHDTGGDVGDFYTVTLKLYQGVYCKHVYIEEEPT